MHKTIQFTMAILLTGMLLGSGTAEANRDDRLWGGIVGAVFGSALTSVYYHDHKFREKEKIRYFPRRYYPPRYRGDRNCYPYSRRYSTRIYRGTRTYRYRPAKKVKKRVRKQIQKPKRSTPTPVIPLLLSLNRAQKIQKALLELGLYQGRLDGVLDSYQSERALTKFYSTYAPEEGNGLTKELKKQLVTLGELFLFEQALSAKSHTTSAQIRQLQAALKILGYYHGGIDGLMGRKTRGAIRSYNKEKYLEAEAYLDLESKYHLVKSAKKKNRQAIDGIIAGFSQKRKPYVEARFLSRSQMR